MRRARRFATIGLTLAAALPAAPGFAAPPKPSPKPAIVLPPRKPAALAAQQKKIEAQQKKAEAAAQKKAATAAQKKLATAAQPKNNQAAKPEPKTYDFSDYFRVWGVSGDTTRAEIVARFGEPQRVGDWASKPFYYFNDTLTFIFASDDTVGTMIVGNSFAPIPPNSIPPEVIAKAFIGRTRDDVLKAFGPANSVSSDNYRYWPKTGVYKVEFQCYDFERYVCKQMLVQF
jgi:hypothetical protein